MPVRNGMSASVALPLNVIVMSLPQTPVSTLRLAQSMGTALKGDRRVKDDGRGEGGWCSTCISSLLANSSDHFSFSSLTKPTRHSWRLKGSAFSNPRHEPSELSAGGTCNHPVFIANVCRDPQDYCPNLCNQRPVYLYAKCISLAARWSLTWKIICCCCPILGLACHGWCMA